MADWSKILSRGNVEDRRGMAPVAVGGISLTSLALLLFFNVLAGGSTEDFINVLENIPVEQQIGGNIDNNQFEGEDSYEVFSSTVLGSNNDMWKNLFNKTDKTYTEPRLVLFRTATNSSCGTATSAVGPHYCPLDNTIYLDETFFDELTARFGARGGDVAQAYVIAHEVAHHAQNELGIMSEHARLSDSNPDDRNSLSIKLELQADCFAGLWLNSIKDLGVLERGEVIEAMDAAASVGDDRIQESITGRINPENWTHGSSDDRQFWFDKGFATGNLSSCNTFE